MIVNYLFYFFSFQTVGQFLASAVEGIPANTLLTWGLMSARIYPFSSVDRRFFRYRLFGLNYCIICNNLLFYQGIWFSIVLGYNRLIWTRRIRTIFLFHGFSLSTLWIHCPGNFPGTIHTKITIIATQVMSASVGCLPALTKPVIFHFHVLFLKSF